MYHFAILVLMALAVVKLVDFVVGLVARDDDTIRSLLTFVASIGGMLLADYSVFEGFGVAVRDHDTGVWLTGLMAAGCTVAWRAVFGYLTHNHARADETLETGVRLHRAA